MVQHLRNNESWRDRQHAASDRTVKRFAVGLAIGVGLFTAGLITYTSIVAPYNNCGFEITRDFMKRQSTESATNSIPSKAEVNLLKPYSPPSNQIRQ